MKVIACVLFAVAVLCGCSHQTAKPGADYEARKATFRRHSFESKLFVIGWKVPLLSKAEWEQIKPQFEKLTDYSLESAYRDSRDLVRVNLDRRGNPPPGDHLTLFFEKKDGAWIENEAKREETVTLLE